MARYFLPYSFGYITDFEVTQYVQSFYFGQVYQWAGIENDFTHSRVIPTPHPAR